MFRQLFSGDNLLFCIIEVGKKLSELIQDSGNQTPSSEQNRWQAEIAQVAIELIGVVTNSGRASSLAATDAATPILKRIERAAIAAATPITYHARLPDISRGSLAASLLPQGSTPVGFGGYMGCSRVDSSLSTEVSPPFVDIDSEVAQHLKRLARKDPTTKGTASRMNMKI